MVNRVVVGAHYGLKDWILQRVTAVVMALYTLVLGGSLALAGPLSQASWKGMLGQGWMKFATFLFFVSLCYHAWVGVRDIFMDYIKCAAVRLSLHGLVALLLIGYAGWAASILWRL